MIEFPPRAIKLFEANTALDTSPVVALSQLAYPSVIVTGIAVGDIVQVEVANDDPAHVAEADMNWIQQGSDITADGAYAIEPGALLCRLRRSDISGAGSVDAEIAGSG